MPCTIAGLGRTHEAGLQHVNFLETFMVLVFHDQRGSLLPSHIIFLVSYVGLVGS